MDVGPSELLWVIIVLAVLFGASRLPAMGRNLGLGIKEFKRGLSEATRDGQDSAGPRPVSGRERDAST
jgi:sec-independent protein translocase protein TatA